MTGRQRDHRRRQHDTLEPTAAVMAGADDDSATHGMREREDWWGTIRQHHLLHHRLEVGDVVRKAPYIALVTVGKRVIRKPLPAPVERHHRKTARADRALSRNISRCTRRAPARP